MLVARVNALLMLTHCKKIKGMRIITMQEKYFEHFSVYFLTRSLFIIAITEGKKKEKKKANFLSLRNV